MEAFVFLIVSGVIGGALLATVATKLHLRFRGPAGADAFVRQPLSTDMINMASIKVAGIGGLGLVAICAIIALTIPSIGVSVGTGLVTGGILAIVWISRRRQAGPLPSSGKGLGANTMLAIDGTDEHGVPATDGRPDQQSISFVPV